MKNILYSVLILAFLFLSVKTHSQEKSVSHEGFVFSPSTGMFVATLFKSDRKAKGFMIGVDFSYVKKSQIHTFSIDMLKQYMIFSSPDNTYQQLNYLYGRYQDKGSVRLSYEIGLGVLFAKLQDQLIKRDPGILGHEYYKMKSFSSLAVPLEFRVHKLLKNGNSFGFDLNININKKYLFVMPGISFKFYH